MLGLTDETHANCHLLRGRCSSLMITMSPTQRFLWGSSHFWRCCRLNKNSFLHRLQNSFAKCWTLLQRFLQYRSADWKLPGGGSTTFVFIVKRWLGVKGLAILGSFRLSTERGRLLMMASTSLIRVLRASSSSCKALSRKSGFRTLQTDLIWRSHTPPMWLAEGTFILKSTRSQFSFSNDDRTRS